MNVDWAFVSVLLTALAGLATVTVQWGVITSKLHNLEKRLDELIFEARTVRADYQGMERRLSRLEGESHTPAPGPTPGISRVET